MSQLYLIGTAHRDLRGRERLGKALELLLPQAIVLESPKEFLQQVLEMNYSLFQRHIKYHKTHPPLIGITSDEITYEGIDAFIKTHGYEATLSFAYVMQTGALLRCPATLSPKDDNQRVIEAATRAGIDEVAQVAGKPDIFYELLRANQEELEEHQKRMDASYQNPNNFTEQYWLEAFSEREYQIANEARQLRNQGIRTAVIIGSDHIFNDRHNVYRRLEDLNPRKFRLSDFDRPIIIT